MADTKISNLTSYTPAVDTDVMPIVDTTNATTKKITWANIKATLKTYLDTLYSPVFTNSAGLASLLSDETGSSGGVVVFSASPTIVTPTIASMANAQHNHQNAAGGGTLDVASITTGILGLARGGTNAGTKAGAFDSLSPMTTGGDIIYGGASGTGTRLANGSSGQFLKSNGGTSAPSWALPSTLLTQSTTANSVGASSTAEASLFSYSLAGNTLGTTGRVRIRARIDVSIAGNENITVRLKYGATTIITNIVAVVEAGTPTLSGFLDIILSATGATGTQAMTAFALLTAGANGGYLTNSFPATQTMIINGRGTSSEDSTAAKTIDCTFQFSVNSGSNLAKVWEYMIEAL